MRNPLFIALTATVLGVLLDQWLKKKAMAAELSPDAKASGDVAQVFRSGSPDAVMGANYWSAFGAKPAVGESASQREVTGSTFSGYAALGRSASMQ